MEITVQPTKLQGVVIIDTAFVYDERGFFVESWHKERFAANGLTYEFVQDNHSRSAKGVVRGLHYQDMTAPQGKLVRCPFGRVWDVAVDLRMSSPTFGQWIGVELSAENMRQIMIPPGFGHGFVALSDVADLQYKCTGYYAPSAEGSVRWDDLDIAIDWPVQNPTLSPRDQNASSLAYYRQHPAFA